MYPCRGERNEFPEQAAAESSRATSRRARNRDTPVLRSYRFINNDALKGLGHLEFAPHDQIMEN